MSEDIEKWEEATTPSADRIKELEEQLKAVLDRESASQKRHDKKVEALEAELLETQDRANAFATKEYHTEMRAKQAEAELKKARREALEEASARCAGIFWTGVCGSGTEYDNGHKSAAQRCMDEIEGLIDEG